MPRGLLWDSNVSLARSELHRGEKALAVPRCQVDAHTYNPGRKESVPVLHALGTSQTPA